MYLPPKFLLDAELQAGRAASQCMAFLEYPGAGLGPGQNENAQAGL